MKRNFSEKTRGVTIVELVFATTIFILLMHPVLLILKSGMQSSFHGMLHLETMSEARRILKQVHNDLKLLSYNIKPDEAIVIDPQKQVRWSSAASFPTVSYTFNTFPSKGEISQIAPVSTVGLANIYTSQVTYSVVPDTNPAKPFFKLIRKERFPVGSTMANEYPGGVWENVLSKKINTFQIRLISFEDHEKNKQYFFLVNLQLVDSLKDSLPSVVTPGTALNSRQSGIVLADFHDVVYSDAITLFSQNHRKIRNWYTNISGLPLPAGVDLKE
ncbi:MAG: hypothetical protein HQM10_08195 [Candidatus Riflebacteria bacterium]|nr:hypothetical protein [Candidatus Riflebacteria bacterium]